MSVCLFVYLFAAYILQHSWTDLAIFLFAPYSSGEGFKQQNYGSGIQFLQKSGLIDFLPYLLYLSQREYKDENSKQF